MKEGEKELSEAENLPENDDKRERKIADAEGKKHKAKLLIDLEQATKRQQAAEEKAKSLKDEKDIKENDEEMKAAMKAVMEATTAFNRDEEARKREEANRPENMDDFTLKQREVNNMLTDAKDTFKQIEALKGSRSVEDVEASVAAKKQFSRIMRNATKGHDEMIAIWKKDNKQETALMKSNQSRFGDNATAKEELQTRSALAEAFKGQIEELRTIMMKGTKKRERPKASDKKPRTSAGVPQSEPPPEAPGVDSSALDALPDLDPSSWEDYQKFVKGDEEVDAMLEQMLNATKANYDKAAEAQEEGKKQDVLSQKLHDSVGEALDASHQANEMADDVLEKLDETPWCKIGCYAANVAVIGGCGYFIYSMKFS